MKTIVKRRERLAWRGTKEITNQGSLLGAWRESGERLAMRRRKDIIQNQKEEGLRGETETLTGGGKGSWRSPLETTLTLSLVRSGIIDGEESKVVGRGLWKDLEEPLWILYVNQEWVKGFEEPLRSQLRLSSRNF